MFGKEEYREINANLNRQLEEKQVLIAVHRGTWGGNVAQNTIQAYRISREMGGDIFECDLAPSTDGVFYAFHDGTEPGNLGRQENIKTMSSQEIDSLVYINTVFEPSGVHVEKLEDILRTFCHGELFNIDRAWDHLLQLIPVLDRYPHTLHQAIIKTPVKPEYLGFFQNCPQKYPYMAIVQNLEEVEQALAWPGINLVGMELQASTKEDDLFQDALIQRLAEAFGSRPSDILAAIGPGISVCCFETHQDVPDGLRAHMGAAADPYIHPIPSTEKYHVDLKGLNRAWLLQAGVPSEHIAVCSACTACDLTSFWSHRRQGPARGSMAALIQISKE